LKSEQKSFFFQKIIFVFGNIENQIIKIVEVIEIDTIENCHLISDLLHFHFKGNFALWFKVDLEKFLSLPYIEFIERKVIHFIIILALLGQSHTT
jgi:hypothetical protein